MRIKAGSRAIRELGWRDYALRFVAGGLVTTAAGLVDKGLGPVIGGLFLAFPSIFPASASLVEKHARRRGRGKRGERLARLSVAAEAAGAALGCLGLAAFAAVVRYLLPGHAPALAIALATSTWAAVSFLCWVVVDRLI